jgi:hypothetical protein
MAKRTGTSPKTSPQGAGSSRSERATSGTARRTGARRSPDGSSPPARPSRASRGKPAAVALSPALEKALDDHPRARARWNALAPSHRKEYVSWIASAKRAETAARRLALAVEKLLAGVKTPMRANDAPAVSAAPLARKLGIKPDTRVVVIAGPDTDCPRIEGAASRGPGDLVLAFARDKMDLERIAPRAFGALAPGASLWIAYRKRAPGVESDLSRDGGWEAVTREGWQVVSLVAVDTKWSALRFKNNRRQPQAARG